MPCQICSFFIFRRRFALWKWFFLIQPFWSWESLFCNVCRKWL